MFGAPLFSRVILYLALIGVPALCLDWYDFILTASALVLSFGAVDLADILMQPQPGEQA